MNTHTHQRIIECDLYYGWIKTECEHKWNNNNIMGQMGGARNNKKKIILQGGKNILYWMMMMVNLWICNGYKVYWESGKI